jgi:hypothetical protein
MAAIPGESLPERHQRGLPQGSLSDTRLGCIARVCSGVVDSTLKHTTGQKHPLAKTYRLNAYGPYVFGLYLVGLMLQ